MQILIVDQCSASKAYGDGVDSLEADDIDATPEELLEATDAKGIKAGDLYTGKQQRRINEAVRRLREKGHGVDQMIISAGFGLVSETEKLPPYDVTFSGKGNDKIRQRGEELEITTDLINRVEQSSPYDLVFFALGAKYYQAIDVDRVLRSVPESTLVILFNRESDEERWETVVSLPARTEQAKEHGSTVIGLKGTYLKNFARRLGEGDVDIEGNTVRKYCTATESTQTDFEQY